MAFEGCEPITLSVCENCVGHLANGEAGCCHDDRVAGVDVSHLRRPEWDPRHPARPAPCPTALRIERQNRDVEDLTLGCTNEECGHCHAPDGQDTDEPWFSWSACEGCGVNLGGNREHATAWVRRDDRIYSFSRRGWLVTIRRTRCNRSHYAVAYRGDEYRSLFSVPHGGAERWARAAAFVSSLPI